MKMFLVVMCDIFLILYLTALSQVNEQHLSDLTVDDYRNLEISAEEHKLLALAREQELTTTGDLLEKLKEQMRLADLEKKKLEKELVNVKQAAEKSAETVSNKEQQYLAALKESQLTKEQLEQAQRQQQELKVQMAKVVSSERELQERLKEIRDQMQKTRSQAELAEKQRKDAEAEAFKSRQLAEQARKREELALQQASEAAGAVIEAKSETFGALTRAEQAEKQAKSAKRQVVSVTKEMTKTKTKLKAVTQPASKAYHVNLQSRIVAVRVQYRTGTSFGSGKKKDFSLKGLPVKVGIESIVFFPQDQVFPDSRKRRFKYFNISLNEQLVKKVYVSNTRPRVVGIVLPTGQNPAKMPLAKSSKLEDYMPTLFAVRNGARMKFGDRLRSLDKELYLFQRDRLTLDEQGYLEYSSKGFRGSKDFGERIVKGDQVVDLEGALLGVATDENVIRPIRDINGWKEVILADKKPEEFIPDIQG